MYICGQENLRVRLDYLIKENKLPRFIIICGDVGYGKKVISDYIAKSINANFVPCELKVESVRDVVNNSYTVTEKTLYMFADCDSMSTQSKNALLKVTEEPSNNSYFVMTVKDISNILGTLISRGTVFYMEPYTQKDILDFIDYKKYSFTSDVLNIIKNICICPQDVMEASNVDIKQVYELADKFIQFIGNANLGNELKMVTMLSTKKDDNKISPVIFLRCILLQCNRYIMENCSKEDLKAFNVIIKQTCKAIQDLNHKGSSKQIILDNWIVNTHMLITGGEF